MNSCILIKPDRYEKQTLKHFNNIPIPSDCFQHTHKMFLPDECMWKRLCQDGKSSAPPLPRKIHQKEPRFLLTYDSWKSCQRSPFFTRILQTFLLRGKKTCYNGTWTFCLTSFNSQPRVKHITQADLNVSGSLSTANFP